MALNRPGTARTVEVVRAVRDHHGEQRGGEVGQDAAAVPRVVEPVREDDVRRVLDLQYHITRPLAPPYSLHTVLLKVESYNDTQDDVRGVLDLQKQKQKKREKVKGGGKLRILNDVR